MVRYEIDKNLENLDPKEQEAFLDNLSKDLKKRIKAVKKVHRQINAKVLGTAIKDVGEGVGGLTVHNLPYLMSLVCPIIAITCSLAPTLIAVAAAGVALGVKGLLTRTDKLDDQEWYLDCIRCADFAPVSCKDDVKAIKQQIKEIEQMKKSVR